MTDQEIIELFFKREERAIQISSQKYHKYCTSIARNILGDTRDVEECVNETFYRAWNTIPPNRPKRLELFLGKIVRNISFDLYRKRKAKKRGNGEIECILEELEECICSHRWNPERILEEKELKNLIDSFLESLNSDSRNIFIRRYWFSDSVRSICTRYKMSEGKVKGTLFRTRRKLQDYLEKEGILI